MSIPDANITGNFGLKDQQMAMHWIKDNIQPFGGDPNRITLVGWSAGAAAVSYHLYANTSKGLFHKAILMSGNMLDPWAFNSAPYECSKSMPFMLYANKKFPPTYNNNSNSFNQILHDTTIKHRLQTLKSTQFFTNFSKQFLVIYFGIPNYCFVPTYDNEFSIKRPSDMIQEHSPSSLVPLLIGSTENEGNNHYRYEFEMKNVQFPNDNHTVVRMQIQNYMRHILNESSVSPFKSHKKRQEFIQQLQGIADINYGINQFLNAYTNHTNEAIYLYRFSYDGKFGQEYNEKYTSGTAGAAVHGDELGYLLKDRKMIEDEDENEKNRTSLSMTTSMSTITNNNNNNSTNVEFKDEILTRKRMVEMWTNFIKYGYG